MWPHRLVTTGDTLHPGIQRRDEAAQGLTLTVWWPGREDACLPQQARVLRATLFAPSPWGGVPRGAGGLGRAKRDPSRRHVGLLRPRARATCRGKGSERAGEGGNVPGPCSCVISFGTDPHARPCKAQPLPRVCTPREPQARPCVTPAPGPGCGVGPHRSARCRASSAPPLGRPPPDLALQPA